MRLPATLAVTVALLSIAAPTALAQSVRVQMSADRTQIRAGEQVSVRIEVQSEGGESPEITLPDFDGFQIVSRQVQRPMQFSFNFGSRAVVRSSVIHTFGLSPVRVGTIPIQPVRVQVGGQVFQSNALRIEVTGDAMPGQANPPGGAASSAPGQPDPSQPAPGAGADAAQLDDQAFLRTVVDKPRPFEREQVTVTIYLYLRERLNKAPNVKQEASTDGFWVHDLLPPNYQLQGRRQTVNGGLYTAYLLRRFAAFPLRAGELTLGPMSIEIDRSSVFDLFGGRRGNPVLTRSGVPITLDVQPLPEEGKPASGAFVGRFTLEARLDRNQAVTGDAVTLTATIRGTGDIRGVRLETPGVPGLRILDPQVKDLVEAPNDLVGGERVYEWLIVPEQPGQFTIPALGFDAFDPATKRYGRVEAPALTLVAAGTALAAATPPEPTANVTPEPTDAAPTAADDDHHWAPVRNKSALTRSHFRVLATPWFPWTLPVPPAVWLLVVVGGALRRRAQARAGTPRQRATRLSQHRLAEARAAANAGDASAFHAATAAALASMLEARMGEPVGGYTHSELRARLVGRGMDEALARDTVDQLEASDYARFSPDASAGDALRTAAERLEATLQRLASFEPTPEEAA